MIMVLSLVVILSVGFGSWIFLARKKERAPRELPSAAVELRPEQAEAVIEIHAAPEGSSEIQALDQASAGTVSGEPDASAQELSVTEVYPLADPLTPLAEEIDEREQLRKNGSGPGMELSEASSTAALIPGPSLHSAQDETVVAVGPDTPVSDQQLTGGGLGTTDGALESQNAESPLSGKADNLAPPADSPTVPGEEHSSADSTPAQVVVSIETSSEFYDEPAGEIGIPDVKAEDLTEMALVPSVALPTPGNGLPAENAVVEMAAAGVAQSPEDELPQDSADVEQAKPPQHTEPVERNAEKVPQRYRPPPQKSPRAVTRTITQDSQRAAPSEVSLDIRIRLTFDRFGFCVIALLPERTSGLDNEVAVKLGGLPLLLVAQEDWYQDLQVDRIGDYLRQGVEVRGVLADDRSARWLLTGRDLYVLASHHRASGFVSTNRLSLGRSHVVLCSVELLREVEAILSEAGCEGYTKLDESHGVPSGWIGLRSVTPTKAIPLILGSDPFYAVKPAPDIEIDLEGGVCLRNSVWLAGYPPRIKLLGESSGAVRVLIDGKEAQPTEGCLIVDGYDTSGRHSVYCEGLSCSSSYSIEDPPDSWEEWPAHHFGEAGICGPLVQLAPETVSGRPFTGPMSNPLLLGAEPGQIFRCSPRNVAFWKGFVPFDVVWALPAQPLRCNKKTARILQFVNAPVAPPKPGRKPALVWSNAILDASRKGLRIENESPDSTARWSDYKKAARAIWRAAR